MKKACNSGRLGHARRQPYIQQKFQPVPTFAVNLRPKRQCPRHPRTRNTCTEWPDGHDGGHSKHLPLLRLPWLTNVKKQNSLYYATNAYLFFRCCASATKSSSGFMCRNSRSRKVDNATAAAALDGTNEHKQRRASTKKKKKKSLAQFRPLTFQLVILYLLLITARMHTNKQSPY